MAKEVKKTQEKNNKKKAEEKVVKNSVKDKKVGKNVKKEKKEAVTKKVETVKPEKVKIKKEKNNEKLVTLFKKVDDKRFGIILFVVGFLIATLLFRCILWPDRIATLKDGTQPIATLNEKTITADDLYERFDIKRKCFLILPFLWIWRILLQLFGSKEKWSFAKKQMDTFKTIDQSDIDYERKIRQEFGLLKK